MGSIANIFRTCIEGFLTPFDWLGPFWGLTILSLLSGVIMLWVVGKTTPQALVERCRAKMDSSIYEIRLFLDSPKRVLISVGRLMGNSLLYIATMLPAFVILALPLGLMYLSLEARHGLAPIETGDTFVLSATLGEGVNGRSATVETPGFIEETAPAMFVQGDNAIYLRLRATEAKTGTVALVVEGKRYEKEVVFDPDAVQVAPERSSGLDLFFSYGPEAPLRGDVESITVPHDAKDTSYLGIDMPWWIWWLSLMMVAAFALRKPMGVTI